MRRLAKKIAASVMALTLVLAMGTTCFAATWGSWFGVPNEWWEGADGALTANSASGFTATINSIGWGGVWGGQVYIDGNKNDNAKNIKVKKGQTYTLSFSIKATNVTKYVYVKVATGETLAYSRWVRIPANKTQNVKVNFKAAANANSVYFALGGDAGNREGVVDDKDAKVRYGVFQKQFKKSAADGLMDEADGDFTAQTVITVSKFTLIQQPKLKSVKSRKKGKVTVKFGKVAGAKLYKVKVGSKVYKTKKATVTVKAKSKKRVKVQVAAVAKSSNVAGAYSKAKRVKVK